MKVVSSNSLPTLSHPGRLLCLRANNSMRLRPKQNRSMISYSSSGFLVLARDSSSAMITSVSTLAWIKCPSEPRLTVPLMPTRQCSFTRFMKLNSSLTVGWFLRLVLAQMMSSHLRRPQCLKSSRASSKCSLDPHQRNTNEGTSAILSILSPLSSSSDQGVRSSSLLILFPLLNYSSHGGSIKMTSNLPNMDKLSCLRSLLMCTGGMLRFSMTSFLSDINSYILGWFSNLRLVSLHLIKFAGLTFDMH
mmetsp:Transcript_14725/g.32174  ORF Transcript_14725/g.32174 Transcript_14725/m.32174 type:complete len:248 (+) Transcript_14725:131-874(+)